MDIQKKERKKEKNQQNVCFLQSALASNSWVPTGLVYTAFVWLMAQTNQTEYQMWWLYNGALASQQRNDDDDDNDHGRQQRNIGIAQKKVNV